MDGSADEDGPKERRSRLPWFVVLALFEVMAIAGPVKMIVRSVGDDDATGGGSVVKMAGLKFAPAELTVPRGTVVLFDNNDVAPHTVTANDNSIDSGTLRPGGTFTLTVNGRLDYFCAIHPSMTATIQIAG